MRSFRDCGVDHKLPLCTFRLRHQGREEKEGPLCSKEATRKEERVMGKRIHRFILGPLATPYGVCSTLWVRLFFASQRVV